MTRMHNGVVALAIPISCGLAMLAVGLTIPVYSDVERASWLKVNVCSEHGVIVIDNWYEQISLLETLRHPLMQGGFSLILAALTVGVLFKLFGGQGPIGIRTPKYKPTYFALGLGVIALSWFSQMQSLYIDLSRGEFPTCADSIGIPMMALNSLYTALVVVALLVGAILTIFFKPLSIALPAWRSDRPLLSWMVTILLGIIALIVAFLGVFGAVESSFIGTPAAIVALYVIASTHAALLGEAAGHETFE